MLSFLWWVKGSAHLEVPAEADARLLRQIATYLEAQGKGKVRTGFDQVEFNAPFAQTSSRGAVLAPFDLGRISIERYADKARLRYRLRALHGFIFCVVLAVLFSGFVCLLGHSNAWADGALVALGIYAANALISLVRVPLLFRKWAREAGD